MSAVRLSLRFDPERLERDARAFSEEEWLDHFVKQNYQGAWTVIPLRGPEGAEHPVMMMYSDPSCAAFADTPFLQRSPYLREVVRSIPCDLQSVRLMRLSPGSVIREHRDHDLSLELGMARLHVPVVTNERVDFRLAGERLRLRVGECWYLPLSQPHSVRNDGSTDRIHLVLDAVPNAWLREQIEG